MDNSRNPIIARKRLLCPKCGEGVIKVPEQEERNGFHERSIIFPRMNVPTCNNCGTNFVVEIDKTLLIKFRAI